MHILVDTHLLLWAAAEPTRLPAVARRMLQDSASELYFSVASLWEIAIKVALGRPSFNVDTPAFRRNLLDNGYAELAIEGRHILAVSQLHGEGPALAAHKDPFDRILIAQAIHGGMTFLTADKMLGGYGSCVKIV